MSDTVKFDTDPDWEDYATLLRTARASPRHAKPHLDKSSPDLMQGPAPWRSRLFCSCRAPDRGAAPLTRQKARSQSRTPPSRPHGWGGPRPDAVLGPRIHFGSVETSARWAARFLLNKSLGFSDAELTSICHEDEDVDTDIDDGCCRWWS